MLRLVAATNRDLEQMMENREFRSDLYYRLNVFPIRIPALARTSGRYFLCWSDTSRKSTVAACRNRSNPFLLGP